MGTKYEARGVIQGNIQFDSAPLQKAFKQLGASLGFAVQDVSAAVNTLAVATNTLAPAVHSLHSPELELREILLVLDHVLNYKSANDPDFFEAIREAENFIVYLKGLVANAP